MASSFRRLLLLAAALISALLLPVVVVAQGAGRLWCSNIDGGIDMCRYDNSFNKLQNRLNRLALEHPNRASVGTLGLSVRGNALFFARITAGARYPHRAVGEPMVRIMGNFMGDEPVGRQLTIYLAEYLLAHYGKDERITRILNNTEIHLVPTVNPDGYERAVEGCSIFSRLWQGNSAKLNANRVDLRKDYPRVFSEPQSVPVRQLMSGRQPETRALIEWTKNNPFVLSLEIGNGDLMVTYPFADSPLGSRLAANSSSPTPDDALYNFLARVYSDNHPDLSSGEQCPNTAADRRSEWRRAKKGVANEAEMAVESGTLMDFSYVHTNSLEFRAQVTCCRYPPSGHLVQIWRQNKESLLRFLEAAQQGIKGLVVTTRGEPVHNAGIVVSGNPKVVRTTPRGEYWRVLPPGTYTVFVVAAGFEPTAPEAVLVPDTWPPQPVVKHFMIRRLAEKKAEETSVDLNRTRRGRANVMARIMAEFSRGAGKP